MSAFKRPLLFLAAASLPMSAAQADEGMWTFDAFPTAKMKADYGWAPDQKWLDKARQAAVRLSGSGCSASFVSASGLILTNQHCVAECLSDLSTPGNDLLKSGLVAKSRMEERQCPGEQAEVLTSIRDVTGEVKAAVGALEGEAAVKARTAVIARIEDAACPDKDKNRC